MRESELEAKIVREVKKRKGIAYKFSSPSRRGVADRLIVFPNGKSCFLEVKAPGCKPSVQQKKFISTMRMMGHQAYWTDSLDHAKIIFDACQDL